MPKSSAKAASKAQSSKAKAKPKTTSWTKNSISRSKPSGGSATQTILNVTALLARLTGSNDVLRERMVAFAKGEGVLGKSTIANAITKLKRDGSIIMASPQVITVTEEGFDRAATSGDLSFASNQDYHRRIQEQMKLNSRSRELVEELSDGRVRQKKEVAASIGCKMNSTWANMLTPLKKLNILQFDRETIQLTDDMFPFGRPGAV